MRHKGNSIKEVFSNTKYISVRDIGSGLKYTYFQGLNSSGQVLWHAHMIGPATWAGIGGQKYPVNLK